MGSGAPGSAAAPRAGAPPPGVTSRSGLRLQFPTGGRCCPDLASQTFKSRSNWSSSPAPRRQELRKSHSSAVAVGVVGAHDADLPVVRCMQVPAGPLSQLRYSHFVSTPSLVPPTHALHCGNAKGCLYLVVDCYLQGRGAGWGEGFKSLGWGGTRRQTCYKKMEM